MKRLITSFNKLIAIFTSNIVATMACTYTFLIWSLLPLVVPRLEEVVFYVSGGILQLVLLPLIMVAQKIVGENQEKQANDLHEIQEARAKEDHETLLSEFSSIKEILSDVAKTLDIVVDEKKSMEEIIGRLEKLEEFNEHTVTKRGRK